MSARQVIRNISLSDLMRYRLPVPGVLSILHRVSGALMFLLLPWTLRLLDLSLGSALGYQQVRELAGGWIARTVLALLAWALLHHLVAGIRFLLLDMDLGVERAAARRSAWVVFGISVPLALWAALVIFGVI
jgi:succinate dehydrogenase / fumarate reductase cytochrome b subunit